MIEFDIKQLVPRFLMRDKNGRALAKAIEAALVKMNAIVKDGVDIIADVAAMPEWRLDEMAWEYNMLYDHRADIESKRRIVKDAIPTYQMYGTPKLVKQMVIDLFGDGVLEEWWEYDAEPYHFRVRTGNVVEGTQEAEKLRQMIMRTKNLRSYMDGILFETGLPALDIYSAGVLQVAYLITMDMEV